MTRQLLLTLAAATALIACGSSSEPQEDSLTAIVMGDTIEGKISISTQTDSFLLVSPTSELVAIYLQAVDQNVVTLGVDAWPDISTPLVEVRASFEGSQALLYNRTRHLTLLAGEQHKVYVRTPAATPNPYRVGRYRLVVVQVDTTAEGGSSTLAPDVQVTGSFSNSADVDSWTLPGSIGDTVALRLAVGLMAPGNLPVEASLVGRSTVNFPDAFEVTAPPDTVLRYSGMLTPCPCGSSVSVRIGLAAPFYYNTAAPLLPNYRVKAQLVDLRPEHRPAITLVGDSTTTETIDSMGDVDVYSFVLTHPGKHVRGFLQVLTGDPADTLTLEIRGAFYEGDDFPGGQPIAATVADTALAQRRTGVFSSLADLSLSVHVKARHLATPASRPAYRFVLLPDTLPH